MARGALVAGRAATENATMTELDTAGPQVAYRPADGFFDELFDADGSSSCAATASPRRYVSGYLWAAPADGGDDSVEVETHAWLEALLRARTAAASRSGWAPTRRTASSRASGT
jgi:hypothetical protein